MSNEKVGSNSEAITQIFRLLGLTWIVRIGELIKIARKLLRGLSQEGIYEVLDYETTLELMDRRGERAFVKKREKVRFLQNNIYAFQDQAWGDGKILIDYCCSPGTPVDCYRVGYKNIILISLRDVKNRGDVEEFNIAWKISKGFLLPTGFWATEISHRTKKIKVLVIFPKTRPPKRSFVLEKNRQRSCELGKENINKLANGKWEVRWERFKPKLYEQYILNWEW